MQHGYLPFQWFYYIELGARKREEVVAIYDPLWGILKVELLIVLAILGLIVAIYDPLWGILKGSLD